MSTYTYVSDGSETGTAIKQEINDLVESIKSERRKYNEFQIIKAVAFECTKEDCGLSTELQSKVYNILMVNNLQQSMGLAKGKLLDLDFNLSDLTYEEKEKLKEAVQHGLMEKSRAITKELLELGIVVEEDDSATRTRTALSLSAQEKVLLDLKNQLNEKQELYVKFLQELIIVFEEIINLKNKTLPEVAHQKIQACEVQSELLRLRGEIINVKSKVNVFAETTKSMDAYREMLKDIVQQQAECKEKIEELQDLKEKYKQVSCKQYEEILKSYLQYKSNIEKKRLLFSQFQSK